MSNNAAEKIKNKGGKRIADARAKHAEAVMTFPGAIEALASLSNIKFDETFEIVFNLGIDAKQTDQLVRGVASMPAGTGKNVRVAAFVKDENVKAAQEAGADLAGSQELIELIKAGKINFDRCIATPDMMPVISQVARILGPKGLMPNPKLGTVTVNFVDAIKSSKAGEVQFRNDKAGIVHAPVGKVSFKTDGIISNIKSLVASIMKSKPKEHKGSYIKAIYLSTTMGPSIKIDSADLKNMMEG